MVNIDQNEMVPLEMFGFIEIESNPNEIDTFWLINRIDLTDCGRGLFDFVSSIISDEDFFLSFFDNVGHCRHV